MNQSVWKLALLLALPLVNSSFNSLCGSDDRKPASADVYVVLDPIPGHSALQTLAQRSLSDITLAGAVGTTIAKDPGADERRPVDVPLPTPQIIPVPGSDVHLPGQNFSTGGVRPARNRHRICYQPLYFEDANLERCGHSHGVFTDALSAAHFFGRVPMVPYLLTAQPPERCVAALPDCPVCHRFSHEAYLPPPTKLSVATESAAVVGLIFLIP